MTDTSEMATIDRISVTLTPKAREALNLAAEATEDTKTDVVNKALRIYHELIKADRNDRGVYIRTSTQFGTDNPGELERIRFV